MANTFKEDLSVILMGCNKPVVGSRTTTTFDIQCVSEKRKPNSEIVKTDCKTKLHACGLRSIESKFNHEPN